MDASAIHGATAVAELSRLELLPYELREQILGHAVVQGEPIIITLKRENSSLLDTAILPALPAVAHLNRALCTQALEIYFKRNTFIVEYAPYDLMNTNAIFRSMQHWFDTFAQYSPESARIGLIRRIPGVRDAIMVASFDRLNGSTWEMDLPARYNARLTDWLQRLAGMCQWPLEHRTPVQAMQGLISVCWIGMNKVLQWERQDGVWVAGDFYGPLV